MHKGRASRQRNRRDRFWFQDRDDPLSDLDGQLQHIIIHHRGISPVYVVSPAWDYANIEMLRIELPTVT